MKSENRLRRQTDKPQNEGEQKRKSEENSV